jgi:glycosyltransferase involved in cell wall biosynthesis
MGKLQECLNKYPAVSVVLNTHNSEKTPALLERALTSVAAQVFNETWELLLVVDGLPSQEIQDIVKKFTDAEGSDEGDLFILANGTKIPLNFFGAGDEPSGYQCYPKNQGITLSKGEFICFLDHDNEFTPNHLQVLWDTIHEGNVWPDFAYGRRHYVIDFSEDEEVEIELPEGQKIKLQDRESPYVEWNQENIQMLGQPMTNFIDTSDFMISKGALWNTYLATGMMWNEGKRRFGDWELIARMVFYAGIRGKGVDEIVQIYHWTGDNMQLTRPLNEVPDKKAI